MALRAGRLVVLQAAMPQAAMPAAFTGYAAILALDDAILNITGSSSFTGAINSDVKPGFFSFSDN